MARARRLVLVAPPSVGGTLSCGLGWRRLEHQAEHLVHAPDEVDLELGAHFGGTSSRSRSLRCGMSTRLDPRAVRGEELLLDAADRQHAAAQRDLAGHRDVGFTGQSRRSDATAANIVTPALGPSLGVPPLRDVHVQIDDLQPLGREHEPLGARAHERHRRRRRLLHHAPQVAGERRCCPCPGILRRLDEEDVAAAPASTRGRRHAGRSCALGDLGRGTCAGRAPSRRARAWHVSCTSSPSARRTATCRHTAAISRSRPRTPASRV